MCSSCILGQGKSECGRKDAVFTFFQGLVIGVFDCTLATAPLIIQEFVTRTGANEERTSL